MTKSFLNQNFDAVYGTFLLCNRNGCTLIAGSQKLPGTGGVVFAYLPFPGEDEQGQQLPGDFDKIECNEVVALFTNVRYKSKQPGD